jgi:hypothetical protein
MDTYELLPTDLAFGNDSSRFTTYNWFQGITLNPKSVISTAETETRKQLISIGLHFTLKFDGHMNTYAVGQLHSVIIVSGYHMQNGHILLSEGRSRLIRRVRQYISTYCRPTIHRLAHLQLF